MAPRFRYAMMWLLLLALPLQGLAAATMLHCGPSHHRMMAIAEPRDAKHHETDTPGAHHEHAQSTPQIDKLMKFKCSACAVCCVGAAIPSAAVNFEPLRTAMVPDSFVPLSHAGFVTDGPDRPPRLSHV